MASEAKQDDMQDGTGQVIRPVVARVAMSGPRKFTRKRKAQTPEVEPAPVPPMETRAERLARRQAAEEAALKEASLAQAEKLKLEEEARLRAEAEARAKSQRESAEKMRAKMAQEAEAKRRAADQQAAEARAAKAARSPDPADVRKALDRQSAQDLAEAAQVMAEREAAQRRSAERTRLAAEKAKRAAQLLEDPVVDRPVSDQSDDLVAKRARAKVMLSPQTRVDIPPEDPIPQTAPVADPEPAVPHSNRVRWDKLRTFTVDEKHLNRNRVITASRADPAHAAFDILRTRLLQALRDRGWHRVAITSPTKNCGKTFTAANLAISLSRQENCRTILMDLDLRNPSLHKVLGASNPGAIGDMLRGKIPPEDHLRRMGKNQIHAGHNIAFGFNDEVEPYASELLQETGTAEVLAEMEARFDPDIVLFDLPPALYHDDVMGFRPQFDGVLLVVGGGVTSPKEVKDVERRLGAETPLLGTVLNYAEGANVTKYSY